MCATERDPLDGQLQALQGRDVRGLKVSVVHRAANDVPMCDAVFVPQAEGIILDALQRAAAGRPMLTISDQPGFVDRGGMIEMKLVAGRTRFDINLAAAQAAGLSLSSQRSE
ncbi:YfiR family protein, partial [Arthrospira platensis SPKY1]|nr:YfiR family protein [Arthrospira platensis SPKY1]